MTSKNVDKVIEKLIAGAKGDKEGLKFFCERLDAFLDDLANDDFFGTEKQCDPRGDQRG